MATSLGNDAPAGGLWDQPNKKPRKVSQKSDGLLGSLNAQFEVTDAPVANIWDEPSWKRTWKTDDSWQMGVAGPLSVFGQVGQRRRSRPVEYEGQRTHRGFLQGPLWIAGRVHLMHSGPGVSYTDPLHPVRTQGRYRLAARSASPLAPAVRNRSGISGRHHAFHDAASSKTRSIRTFAWPCRSAAPASSRSAPSTNRWGCSISGRRQAITCQLYLGFELTH